MGKLIQFPGAAKPETPAIPIEDDPELADLTQEELAAAYQAAEELGISPELFHVPLSEISAARTAIDAMLAHFEGKWAGVSKEASEMRQQLIADYDLLEVFERMGQSTATDWNQRPAFYGALAMRVLEELEPLKPQEDSSQSEDNPHTS